MDLSLFIGPEGIRIAVKGRHLYRTALAVPYLKLRLGTDDGGSRILIHLPDAKIGLVGFIGHHIDLFVAVLPDLDFYVPDAFISLRRGGRVLRQIPGAVLQLSPLCGRVSVPVRLDGDRFHLGILMAQSKTDMLQLSGIVEILQNGFIQIIIQILHQS